MRNTWIAMNTQKLLDIKRTLVKCEFLPEYETFPLRDIQLLLNGTEAEIIKLQTEVDMLKEELKKQIKENKRIHELIADNLV